MNNNNNGGCLAAILAFVFIGGNIFLFTGALTDDLSDNGFAWIMVIAAVIADFALLGWMLWKISTHIESKNEQKRLAHNDAVKKEINIFWSKYEPKYKLPLRRDIQISGNNISTNNEIINCVKSYHANNQKIYDSLSPIYEETYAILNKGKENADKQQELDFLKCNEEKLKQLKNEKDSLVKQLLKNKIEISNCYGNGTRSLAHAFLKLKQSKKISQSNITNSIEELLKNDVPFELSMFEYASHNSNEFLILNFPELRFCFFEKVILVFDKYGFFQTAIDPTMFQITVSRQQSRVTITNGRSTNNDFIATDSKCLQTGTQRTTWTHTCRDGSPDLRYSYNPRIEYRTDVMEYGTVEFEVLNCKAIYTTSSSQALDAMEDAKKAYCVSYEKYHDTIPDLINLFELLLVDKKDIINGFKSINLSSQNEGYFCRIISKG